MYEIEIPYRYFWICIPVQTTPPPPAGKLFFLLDDILKNFFHEHIIPCPSKVLVEFPWHLTWPKSLLKDVYEHALIQLLGFDFESNEFMRDVTIDDISGLFRFKRLDTSFTKYKFTLRFASRKKAMLVKLFV